MGGRCLKLVVCYFLAQYVASFPCSHARANREPGNEASTYVYVYAKACGLEERAEAVVPGSKGGRFDTSYYCDFSSPGWCCLRSWRSAV